MSIYFDKLKISYKDFQKRSDKDIRKLNKGKGGEGNAY